MDIYPGWGDEEAIRFNRLFGTAKVFSNCCDPPISNCDISGESGLSRPVHDLSATNQHIVHELSSFFT
jgi:hypothetical protein